MSYCGFAIYIKKYLKAKEESNVSPCKNTNFIKSTKKKIKKKKLKIFQDIL
jgi:hypothetical protein